jgi:anti-sigma-K factor RskA
VPSPSADFDYEATLAACAGGRHSALHALYEQEGPRLPGVVLVAPADKALQFWTKADGWSGPVSLGLVTPGQRLDVPAGKLPALQPNQLFELTLEPRTGSPTGKPTGPIRFIGRAVKVM